jgi:redox-sensing transcriptional repressor
MIFDKDPSKIGAQFGDFTIIDGSKMVETIRSSGVKVAMVAVPAETAQQVADELVEAGVEAILNYAPIRLNVPGNVRVQHIDPAIHLQRMTYYIE